jgi:hypothetical protein
MCSVKNVNGRVGSSFSTRWVFGVEVDGCVVEIQSFGFGLACIASSQVKIIFPMEIFGAI